MTREDSTSWHRDQRIQRIQIGHIVSTIGLTITLVGGIVQITSYINRNDARIAVIEQQILDQPRRDAKQDMDAAQSDALLRAELQRINDKLDRLIERGATRR